MLKHRFAKLFACLRTRLYAIALTRGVAAAIEHERMLRGLTCETVVDIGANRGQFALAARHCFPRARIISFEPIAKPAAAYRGIFRRDSQSDLHEVAIGPTRTQSTIHISRRDDSSSLLPIGKLQDKVFPGTAEVRLAFIEVGPLQDFVSEEDIKGPALLKIDVQGYELEALRGCEALLSRFAYIYVECSFMELYVGQALAHEVIDWLNKRGFLLTSLYNLHYDTDGQAVQGDFLFARPTGGGL